MKKDHVESKTEAIINEIAKEPMLVDDVVFYPNNTIEKLKALKKAREECPDSFEIYPCTVGGRKTKYIRNIMKRLATNHSEESNVYKCVKNALSKKLSENELSNLNAMLICATWAERERG